MAASSDLQALQLENRNLQQKLDWKQLKINQRDKHIRDLRDATPARAADLERLERSLCRLSLQMEHMQRHKKTGVVVSHLCDAGEDRLLGAHHLCPTAQREQARGHNPAGQAAGRHLHRDAQGRGRAYPPDWVWHAAPPAAPAHSAPPPWAEEQPVAQEGEDGEEGADEEDADEAALRKKAKANAKVERRKEQRHAAAAAAGREPGRLGNPNWVKSDARPARPEGGSSSSSEAE